MKYVAITMISILSLVAQAKQQPAPVYNLTGTASLWTVHHEYNGSTTIDGHTTYAGCNVSDTSVDCDNATGGFMVKLADGTTHVLGDSAWVIGSRYPAWEFGKHLVYSPLGKHLLDSGQKSEAFQYRLVMRKILGIAELYMCIPAPVPDKHDNPVVGEACYSISHNKVDF